MARLQVKDAPKKFCLCSFSKCERKDGVWRVRLAKKSKRDILGELVHQGFFRRNLSRGKAMGFQLHAHTSVGGLRKMGAC